MILGIISPFALVMAVAFVAMVFLIWRDRARPEMQARMSGYLVRALLFLGVGVMAQLIAMR